MFINVKNDLYWILDSFRKLWMNKQINIQKSCILKNVGLYEKIENLKYFNS